MTDDMVHRPPHYRQGTIEVIEVIERLDLGYHAGQVVKYLSRYRYKGAAVQDLKKALWYLNRLIEIEEANARGDHPDKPDPPMAER
jgi:predicted RNase H-like nuclease